MKALVSTISALVIAGALSLTHAKPPGGPGGQPPGGGGPGAGGPGKGGPGQGPGGGQQRPSPEDIFKKLDKDGDGKLSLEEFKAGKPPGGPGGGKGPGGAGKGPGGAGGPGKEGGPGKGEAGAGKGPGGGNQQPPDREEIFKKLDTNNDGFLSLEEFKAGRPPGGPGGPGGKGGKGEGKGPGGKPAPTN